MFESVTIGEIAKRNNLEMVYITLFMFRQVATSELIIKIVHCDHCHSLTVITLFTTTIQFYN